MAARSTSVSFPLAAIGGAVTLASTLVVAISYFLTPVVDPTPLSSVGLGLAAAAGAVALIRPRDVEFLLVADVLVGLAVAFGMYSRGGLVYLPALLFIALGTVKARSRDELQADHLVPAAPVSVRYVTPPAPDELEEAV